MWWLRLTSRKPSGEEGQTIVRIPGESWDDLYYSRDFRFPYLQRMMERGSLVKIEIDYKADNGWGKANAE